MNIPKAIQEAFKYFQAGKLQEAESKCQEIIKIHPEDAKAFHLLGILFYHRDNYDLAIKYIEKALHYNPSNHHTYYDLGNALHNKGQLDKAILCYQNALQLNPNYTDAYNNLGIVLHDKGQLDEAILCYQNALRLNPDIPYTNNNIGLILQEKGQLDLAIRHYQKAIQLDPYFADAYYNLANIYQEKKQFDAAINYYHKAIQVDPHFAYAYNNLGNSLKEKGQLDLAINHYQKALQLNPTLADAYNNIGAILLDLKQFDEAISYCQKALQLNPTLTDAYNNIGAILLDLKQFDEAISYCQKALQLNPNFYKAYHNLGGIYQKKQQFDKAMTYCQKALELNPNDYKVHLGLGCILHEKGQLDEAINCYQKALRLNPNAESAHWSVACAFLLSGNFNEGWNEYEWRWKTKDFSQDCCLHQPSSFSEPKWNGYDIAGLTILIYAEQGLGDTIQFIRFTPLVAQRGGKIIVECDKALASLLHNMKSIDQVIGIGEPLPDFDIQCPLLSLPSVFNTTIENIPDRIPYITVSPTLIKKWRDKIQNTKSMLKVGLVWTGNPEHSNDGNRSCSFAAFSQFFKIKDIIFYSLQKGKSSEQAKYPPKGMHFTDLTDDISDFSDTAALIENLDLVISVDTAVAHLAGALGKPVWTLLPFAPDWRWLLNRNDSPWYSTMRLFRQPSPGDWESAIENVTNELLKFLHKH
jgi:tetratricopeptide (TPR) repeat protein